MPAVSGGKFVVLGGASQVGAHIGEQLLASGAREVVLLDNLSLGSTETMQPMLQDPRCTFVRGDVLRLNELYDAFEKTDGVFAVAGIMGTNMGQNPWMGIEVNVRGFQNALEACRYQGVKKMIFSSSCGIYGAPEDVPTHEDSPMRWQALPPPMLLYTATKVMGEGLARLYQQRYGLDFVALRYSAVYGERQSVRALVGLHIVDACQRIRNGQPPIIEGEGLHVADYIHAADVARANLMAMESSVSGEAINICSGTDTSQKRVVELVTQACGSDLKPEYRQQANNAKIPTKGGRRAYSRDKAKRLLGWEPQISIEEGVGRVLRWVDQQRAML